MLAQEFTQLFREEHRQVRDLLLDLQQAFERRDNTQAQQIVQRIAELTGPHFRYEEESVYPALIGIFGEEYVSKLLSDHDRVIASARRLVALAQTNPLGEAEVQEARALIRSVLPHVSDCDGLSIMVERLPEEQVSGILATRAHALSEGIDLMRWASEVRQRRVN
ncbi:hypothetical protein HRbin16_01870 [bacterium HR16]|nr:hypothetical protein HRbin16_01870 [bacterium HR16]